MSKDVFICHSSQNEDIADRICSLLESRGLSCWIAPRDVGKGLSYDEEILTGIKGSRVLLVLLSEHSDQSRHVKREVEIADQEKKTLFPVRLHDFQPGESLRYYLAGKQWIDVWEKPLDAYGDQITDSVRGLLTADPGDGKVNGQAGKSLWESKKQRKIKRKRILIAAIIIVAAALIVYIVIPWHTGNVIYIPGYH